MRKRILSLFLAFVMILTMLPTQVLAAETELTFNEGTINLAPGTAINGQGATAILSTLSIYTQGDYTPVSIEKATQDGTTINVILSAETDPSAALQAGFTTSTSGITLKHSNNTCTLINGVGSMTTTVTFFTNKPNQGTFVINFSVLLF